jgi:hypothetical protein
MFKRVFLTTAALLAFTNPLIASDCEQPGLPEVPNGAEASLDIMITGQKAVKAFQADAETYRGCLAAVLDDLKSTAEEGDKDAAAAFKAATDDYNASVAAEEKLASDFNSAIQAYKAANPN